MAVIKHAQRIIETIITNQRIKPIKVPETDEIYKYQAEAPKMYEPLPAPETGNLSHLKTGIAQHYRVNNPYRYTELDEYGESVYVAKPWGAYKGPEIGGNKTSNAGAMYDTNFSNIAYIPNTKKKMPTARIYYFQQTHMHRVGTQLTGNTTGGPYQILFEEDGGFKHPLDGFNRSNSYHGWVAKGFKTVEQAVLLCQHLGYAYEVELPRHRYVTRKAYADNFKYKPAKVEE